MCVGMCVVALFVGAASSSRCACFARTVDGSNAVPFVFVSPGGTDGFDGDVDVGVFGDGGFVDFDFGTFCSPTDVGVVDVSSGSSIFSSMVLSPVGGRVGDSGVSTARTLQ